MPATVTYPGVYVQEIAASANTVVAATTSATAFVGWLPRGPIDEVVHATSLGEVERRFGGLHPDSETSYALAQFFLNGGGEAWVVRLPTDAVAARIEVAVRAPAIDAAPALPAIGPAIEPAGEPAGESSTAQDVTGGTVAPGPTLVVTAANPGLWGNTVRVLIRDGEVPGTFDILAVETVAIGEDTIVSSERYSGLTLADSGPRNAVAIVNDQSGLIKLAMQGPVPDGGSTLAPTGGDAQAPRSWLGLAGGADGRLPIGLDFMPDAHGDWSTLPWTDRLRGIAPRVINVLCIPDTFRLSAEEAVAVFATANAFCQSTRSIYLFDIPCAQARDVAGLPGWLSASGIAAADSCSSATYVPPLAIADRLAGDRLREVGPSGTMAGVFARTDEQRGVWKAPAGVAATLSGADASSSITDEQNGTLNAAGINALRHFPPYGTIAWGARTLAGSDLIASDWQYINVRRLVDHIEQSLAQSLQWVVFEPNDDSTWSQIRLEVGRFLSGLFAAGAFSAASADSAFFVRCDATTTTPADVSRGVVNIIVGVAPVQPAEFVVLQIQQMAANA